MKSEPYPGQCYPTQVPHLFSVLFKGIRQIKTKQLISQQFSEFTIIDNLHSYKKWSSEYGIKSSYLYQHLGTKFCWVVIFSSLFATTNYTNRKTHIPLPSRLSQNDNGSQIYNLMLGYTPWLYK